MVLRFKNLSGTPCLQVLPNKPVSSNDFDLSNERVWSAALNLLSHSIVFFENRAIIVNEIIKKN